MTKELQALPHSTILLETFSEKILAIPNNVEKKKEVSQTLSFSPVRSTKEDQCQATKTNFENEILEFDLNFKFFKRTIFE